MTNILCLVELTFKKVLLNEKKMASRKIIWHFLHAKFFMLILLNYLFNSNFSFNLELICTKSCEFFKKLKLHSLKQLVQIVN